MNLSESEQDLVSNFKNKVIESSQRKQYYQQSSDLSGRIMDVSQVLKTSSSQLEQNSYQPPSSHTVSEQNMYVLNSLSNKSLLDDQFRSREIKNHLAKSKQKKLVQLYQDYYIQSQQAQNQVNQSQQSTQDTQFSQQLQSQQYLNNSLQGFSQAKETQIYLQTNYPQSNQNHQQRGVYNIGEILKKNESNQNLSNQNQNNQSQNNQISNNQNLNNQNLSNQNLSNQNSNNYNLSNYNLSNYNLSQNQDLSKEMSQALFQNSQNLLFLNKNNTGERNVIEEQEEENHTKSSFQTTFIYGQKSANISPQSSLNARNLNLSSRRSPSVRNQQMGQKENSEQLKQESFQEQQKNRNIFYEVQDISQAIDSFKSSIQQQELKQNKENRIKILSIREIEQDSKYTNKQNYFQEKENFNQNCQKEQQPIKQIQNNHQEKNFEQNKSNQKLNQFQSQCKTAHFNQENHQNTFQTNYSIQKNSFIKNSSMKKKPNQNVSVSQFDQQYQTLSQKKPTQNSQQKTRNLSFSVQKKENLIGWNKIDVIDKVKKNCKNKQFLMQMIEEHSVCCGHFRKELQKNFN